MPTRFHNGKRMQVMCHRCGTKVQATIYQQRIRWIARLECPHAKKHMGYTMPQVELIKKQLVSVDNSAHDPGVIASREHAKKEIELAEREKRDFAKRQQEFTNRKYL